VPSGEPAGGGAGSGTGEAGELRAAGEVRPGQRRDTTSTHRERPAEGEGDWREA
jgi:hypothetical protein